MLLKRLLTLAILAGLGYGAWIGYQRYTAEDEEQGLGEVPTQSAAIRDITVSVAATGVLRPIKVVQVKSKASGEIVSMPVELGDEVRAGDLIAQVDTRIPLQELNQGVADLESAQVRLEVAERQYQRAQALEEQDLVSQQDLDTSQQNYTTARGAMIRAEAELQLRQERFDDATVRAPSAGRIILKNVEEGTIIMSSTSNVSGGTALVEMADLSRLEIRTLVDEIDIGRVKAGLEVRSTVEAYPKRKFSGTVIKIEPQAVVSQQVTTFPVLSYIDNSDGLLLPGMNADVEVVIHQRPGVLTVPNEAIKTMTDAGQVAGLLNLPFDRDAMRARAETRRAGAGRRGGDTGGSARGAAFAAEPGSDERPEAVTAERRVGGDADAADAGDAPKAADSAEDEEIDFSKMRGMSQAERTKFMADLTDKQRAQLRERFSGGGRGGAGRGAAAGGRNSGASMDAFGVGQAPEAAVVFVLGSDGQMAARQVMIGVRDWEFTEIVSGLNAGDEVVLLPSTSLLTSQQALRDRFSRFSSVPGTGGRR